MSTSNGFQDRVNRQPAPAEPGDFFGTNPRTSVDASAGGFVAGLLGLIVGLMGWGNPASGKANNFFTLNSLMGFVHRENQGLIVLFLGAYTMEVQPGYMATLMSRGDFWGLFTGGGDVGDTVYADAGTGALSAGNAGAGVHIVGATGSVVAATGIMTIAVDGTPIATFAPGQVVIGAGIPDGTTITAQLSGSTGAAGTYQLSQHPLADTGSISIDAYGAIETPWKLASAVAAPTTITGSIDGDGILTVTGASAGDVVLGSIITGTGVPINTTIQSQIGGTALGNGTYQTNTLKVVTSTTLTQSQGQLGKITTWQ